MSLCYYVFRLLIINFTKAFTVELVSINFQLYNLCWLPFIWFVGMSLCCYCLCNLYSLIWLKLLLHCIVQYWN